MLLSLPFRLTLLRLQLALVASWLHSSAPGLGTCTTTELPKVEIAALVLRNQQEQLQALVATVNGVQRSSHQGHGIVILPLRCESADEGNEQTRRMQTGGYPCTCHWQRGLLRQ